MNGSVDALPPGAQLGQYHLIEAASQGGFGILYRAWDEKLNRPVAVKECFPTSICRRDPKTGVVQPHTESLRANYETAINDVYEEAQTLAKLHHARVVPVYDVFRSAGSLFYVMPWLEGGSLRDRIAAGDAISPETAQNWLLELLAALEYLHGMQVIHRDIKPGNIMFDAAGNPVLVDFGSALNRATKVDTTTQGEFSPVYASPEQVSGKGKIGPWTDLYSLAATWYELLTGNAPEPAQQRLVSDDLAPLPSGATVLEQSIMQNLALNAEERCQSAREWQEWLLRGAAPVAVARRRRSRLLWAIPAVLLAAGGAFLLGRQQAEPVQEDGAAQVKDAPDKQELVLSGEFYEKACSQLGIPALLQRYEEVLNKAAACRESYASKLESLYNAGVEDARTHAFRSSPKERGFSLKEMKSPGKTAMSQIDRLLQDWRGEMEGLRYEQLQIARALQTGIRDIEKYCTWNTAEERMLLEKTGLRLEKDYADCLSTHALEQIQKEFEAQCMEQYRSLRSLWYARAEENIRKWETEKAEADAAVLTDEMYHQMSEKRGFSQLLAERKAMDEQAQEIARAGVLAMENELAAVRQTLDAVDADTEESPGKKSSWLGIDFYNQYRDSINKIQKDYIDGRLYALHKEYYKVLKPQLARYRADSYQKPDDDEMSEMEKRMEALFLERAKKEYAEFIDSTPYTKPREYFLKERKRIEGAIRSQVDAKDDALRKRERELQSKGEMAKDEPAAAHGEFYSKVCQQMGIASLATELQEITQRRATAVAEYKEKVDALLQQMCDLRDSGKDAQEIRKSAFALGEEADSHTKSTEESLRQIDALGNACYARMQKCMNSPEDVYPWETQEELSQLLKLKPMLEKDFKPVMREFLQSTNEYIGQYKASEIQNCKVQCGAY